MKYFYQLLIILTLFSKVTSREKEPVTALYFVSLPGDYIGQGESQSYITGDIGFEEDENFTVKMIDNRSIEVFYYDIDKHICWALILSSEEGSYLAPGIYKNAVKCFCSDKNPVLNFGGCGRGFSKINGEFEILELKLIKNEEGDYEVASLAVNFIQEEANASEHAPLFGCLRYKSTIPVQEGFLVESLGDNYIDFPELESDDPTKKEEQNDSKYALYFVSAPGEYVGQGQAENYDYEATDFESIKNFKVTMENNNAIEVAFRDDEKNKNWGLWLQAKSGEAIKPGLYKGATRYPFNRENPGLCFYGCVRGHNTLNGEFEVLELKVTEEVEVVSLAVNFIQEGVSNNTDAVLYGSIRYNSKIPVQKGFLIESLGKDPSDYPDRKIVKKEYDIRLLKRKVDDLNNLIESVCNERGIDTDDDYCEECTFFDYDEDAYYDDYEDEEDIELDSLKASLKNGFLKLSRKLWNNSGKSHGI